MSGRLAGVGRAARSSRCSLVERLGESIAGCSWAVDRGMAEPPERIVGRVAGMLAGPAALTLGGSNRLERGKRPGTSRRVKDRRGSDGGRSDPAAGPSRPGSRPAQGPPPLAAAAFTPQCMTAEELASWRNFNAGVSRADRASGACEDCTDAWAADRRAAGACNGEPGRGDVDASIDGPSFAAGPAPAIPRLRTNNREFADR
jgi:hypothetical protein